MNEFIISDDYLILLWRRLMTMVIPLALSFIIGYLIKDFTMEYSREDLIHRLCLGCLGCVYIFCLVAILFKFRHFNKLKKTKIILDSNKISKIYKNDDVSILWKEIAKVERKEDAKNDIIHLRIISENNESITANGFNNLHELDSIIESNIGNNKIISQKSTINWYKPRYVFILCILLGLIGYIWNHIWKFIR